MALSKTTKIVLVVGGILVIAGVGAYLYMNRRKPTKVEENTDEVLADVFDNLNFEFGKADIKKESLPYLDKSQRSEGPIGGQVGGPFRNPSPFLRALRMKSC
jgi:hypothetical protein